MDSVGRFVSLISPVPLRNFVGGFYSSFVLVSEGTGYREQDCKTVYTFRGRFGSSAISDGCDQNTAKLESLIA